MEKPANGSHVHSSSACKPDDTIMATLLVTGAAGFIGYHTATRLLERGERVVGVDSINDYYDVKLKQARLDRLTRHSSFEFRHLDLADPVAARELFETARPEVVIHLAAQPGVRYSLENPGAYVASNLVAFGNVLEGCRLGSRVRHLAYASSSSVYGANTKMPFSTRDNVDHPVNMYAATKKANELMAHTYSHLYGLPTTGLRFFTVYGPWGRPDMAYFKFAEAILKGRAIDVYGEGRMLRDFTYIDDIVEGVIRVADHTPSADPSWSGDEPNPATSAGPYRVYNIGNHQPESVLRLIELLEKHLGRRVEKRMLPMQPGEVQATFADVEDLERDVGFRPNTSLDVGIGRFVEWYVDYYSFSRATPDVVPST
jgi:UDP-glucuronate 4-epimerase